MEHSAPDQGPALEATEGPGAPVHHPVKSDTTPLSNEHLQGLHPGDITILQTNLSPFGYKSQVLLFAVWPICLTAVTEHFEEVKADLIIRSNKSRPPTTLCHTCR